MERLIKVGDLVLQKMKATRKRTSEGKRRKAYTQLGRAIHDHRRSRT